jgi:hypothetical protein
MITFTIKVTIVIHHHQHQIVRNESDMDMKK